MSVPSRSAWGLLACAALGAASPGNAQLTLRVRVPGELPPGAAVHVAGTFNGWNPGAGEYRLTPAGDGSWGLTLPDEVRGPVEFKFTLGSWERGETDAAGADLPNRRVVVPLSGGLIHEAEVAGWRDGSPPAPRASTARPTVTVLDSAFPVPELGVARRVWIYLPPDYATSGRRYPVLYMHDGQNVFDDATSYAGEWGVDEALDSLHAGGDPGIIVVAVDHGGDRRLDEYSPWTHPRHGGGRGDAYVDFLAQRLKPFIDARYRTLPDRTSTGVAGSSMGGLISLYAALRHPDVFGRVGVFSPAFWFAPAAFAYAEANAARLAGARVYLVTGAREGNEPEVYAGDHARMAALLAGAGGPALEAHLREDGTHSEGFWRREFPAAYLWLFRGDPPQDP